jgi:hypothetical protein
MSRQHNKALAAGYNAEVDAIDELTWGQHMQQFDDCNMNQTWAFGAVTSGRRNISHLVLKLNNEIVSMAQVRIRQLPFLGCGVAYVSWGPMWRRTGVDAHEEDFGQMVRALRNEFVCNRGFTLRLFPLSFEDDPFPLDTVLADEGLHSVGKDTGDRTLLMDLTPPLHALRDGLEKNWRRCLKHSENGELEIIEGSDDDLVDEFIEIYKEMVSRKMFAGSIDFEHLKEIQAQLPEHQKMLIMLCRSSEGTCAGLVSSMMGKMGIDLFAATSNVGTRSYGSYLLRWKLLEKLKRQGVSIHNLNGINPEENPGTYRFKRGMAGKNGRDTSYIGKFDANPSLFDRTLVVIGDALRKWSRDIDMKLAETRARITHAYSLYTWLASQLSASSRVKDVNL